MNPAPQSPPLALFSIANLVIGTGAFIIAGMAVAGVAIDQRGKALSVVFLGISLSYVVGLPLGTWLTSMHSWRLPVQLVALSSLVILAVLMWRLPGHQAAPPVTFKGAGALLRQGAVAWPLVLTLLYFTAIFVVFGYIGPVLQALGPLSVAQASVTLFLFGLSGIVGTLVGGWATDRFGSIKTLRTQMLVFMVVQLVLPLTASHPLGETLICGGHQSQQLACIGQYNYAAIGRFSDISNS